MRLADGSAILVIGALCALPASAADVTKLRSAGALAFGAENVLFVERSARVNPWAKVWPPSVGMGKAVSRRRRT